MIKRRINPSSRASSQQTLDDPPTDKLTPIQRHSKVSTSEDLLYADRLTRASNSAAEALPALTPGREMFVWKKSVVSLNNKMLWCSGGQATATQHRAVSLSFPDVVLVVGWVGGISRGLSPWHKTKHERTVAALLIHPLSVNTSISRVCKDYNFSLVSSKHNITGA